LQTKFCEVVAKVLEPERVFVQKARSANAYNDAVSTVVQVPGRISPSVIII